MLKALTAVCATCSASPPPTSPPTSPSNPRTTLYFTRLQIIETQVPAVEQRVRNVEKVRRDEEKGQVTHRRADVLDNSFGQLDKRVVILMRGLDSSFRNELEKLKDNELSSITHQLSEIESGKNKRLTVSIRTMLEASVQEIRQEFGQRIEEESNLLKSEILDQAVRIIKICDGTCAELNHSLQGLEEKLKGLTKDAEDKSSGMTEALEKRIESEIKELDTNIREQDTKLTSLDNVVQHHARRREKMESLKKEMEKQGNELPVQKSTLEAQQIATQQLLQGV
jgi:hypothetical protein